MSVGAGARCAHLVIYMHVASRSRPSENIYISLSLSSYYHPPTHTYLATGNVHDRMTIRQERQVLPRFGQTADRQEGVGVRRAGDEDGTVVAAVAFDVGGEGGGGGGGAAPPRRRQHRREHREVRGGGGGCVVGGGGDREEGRRAQRRRDDDDDDDDAAVVVREDGHDAAPRRHLALTQVSISRIEYCIYYYFFIGVFSSQQFYSRRKSLK